MAVIAAASLRFLRIRSELDDEQPQRFHSLLPVAALSLPLLGLGLYPLWYLSLLVA